MIRLHKLQEPEILKENREKWTQELLAAIGVEDKDLLKKVQKKYNHKDIKAQLKFETRSKCAYCESRVTVVAHGDIEHVTPKSTEPDRTFEWKNLTFACQICNQKKSDEIDIFDPYVDSMDDIAFLTPPFLSGLTDHSKRTVIKLSLNRPELIEDRLAHIKNYNLALESLMSASEETRNLLLNQMEEELELGGEEYILMKKALLSFYKSQFHSP